MTTFCWDTTLLLHAHRAERLDALDSHLPPGVRHVMTEVVEAELRGAPLPGWLDPVSLDTLPALRALVAWQGRVGSTGAANRGEAAVLAWVEVHGGTPIIDDRSARLVAAGQGVDVHGSLWALAQGVRQGRSAYATSQLCDALLDTGIRWPFQRGGFEAWARGRGLLTGGP